MSDYDYSERLYDEENPPTEPTAPAVTFSGNGHNPQAAPLTVKKKVIPTDTDLAKRWIHEQNDIAWGMGEFRRYEAGVWSVIPEDDIRRKIKTVLEAAQSEGVRPSNRLVNSVLEMARLDILVPDDLWDTNPDVLVCQNGVLHIPTRILRPHAREYYATSALPFEYDPAATAPVFEFVLNACLPEAKQFLQQFVGLALTPVTRYELAIWFQGQPGSGKSTVLEGIQSALGARAGILGLSEIERSRFALTEIPGKTLLVSAEQPATFMTATHTLNAIISGEKITVDRKFRAPVTFTPHAKIIWAMNELPRVSEASNGLFRRVKVIRFPQIPEADRDPAIKDTVKTEGAGILNWALNGLDELTRAGRFVIPDCVQEATKNFRDNNDIPSLFVSEACSTGSEYKVQGQVLYNAYREWCIENGHKPQSSTSIAEDWRRLGFEKHRSAGKTFWSGIGVLGPEKPNM